MNEFDDLLVEYDPQRSRHARRIRLNRKFKARDRYKPRRAVVLLPESCPWRHDPGGKDIRFNRRKTAPETGYGVAYEPRRDVL